VPSTPITVLLVDDHALVRRGFRRMLEDDSEIEILGEASDGHDAVEVAAKLHPAVVVMDFALPSMNGAVATRLVLKDNPQTAVLILSMHAEASYVRTCLEAGANILNFTGTDYGDDLFRLVAEHDAAIILCYVQGRNVREVGDFDLSADPIAMMREHFARQIEIARRHGVEKIFLDPGLGFYYRNLQDSAVRVRHQMTVFLNTFRLRTLGFPICHALPHAFEFFRDEVRCAEPFFAILATLGKTDLFRTHEVPRIKAVLETLKAF